MAGVQFPAPSHIPAGILATDSVMGTPPTFPLTLPAQVALPHAVPVAATWHPPFPSHFAVLPQASPFTHRLASRGAPPAAIGVQVPSIWTTVQLWHPPVQSVLQHTPSAVQCPLTQSVPALQDLPFGRVVPH
jgi:hypothetical protein